MLTGKQVRVRFSRDRVVPQYLDTANAGWLEVAERLLDLFRGQEGRSRGELQVDRHEAFGDDPNQLVHQGLAKLLEDRCEFETLSGLPPDALREAVFRAAAEKRRQTSSEASIPFNRDTVLRCVAGELRLTPEVVDAGLFADLKSEQRLAKFKEISPGHLLERYNVALAQAVILRSTGVTVTIHGEPPQRYRQLLRSVKFHRLICEVERISSKSNRLQLDGPLSLFSATQKYGLQLAMFLPSILLCQDFTLHAELRWGPARKKKVFELGADDRLVTQLTDAGVRTPPELTMFAELFRKRIDDWELREESEVFPLANSSWVPDFRLLHKATGKEVLLEVLGFWRRASVEKHLASLRAHLHRPYLLAVSDLLHIDEVELESLSAGIHRFRNMPLPDEIARLAKALIE